MSEIGDFVTARLIDGEGVRQGVLVHKFRFSAHVEGMRDVYACFPDTVTAPDKNIWLPEVWAHVQRVRQRLGIVRSPTPTDGDPR